MLTCEYIKRIIFGRGKIVCGDEKKKPQEEFIKRNEFKV